MLRPRKAGGMNPGTRQAECHDALAGFAVALLDAARPVPHDLRTWNGSDARQRFAVYRNNVVVSLVNALDAAFPVTAQLVGEEFFRAMAREFVAGHPPASPMLFEYGADFADFIEGFAPAAAVPYLGDVARVEYALTQSTHAADAPVIDPAGFRALLAEPERLASLRFRLHPALGVVRCRYAAASIWAAHHGAGHLEAIDWTAAEDVLVTRPHMEAALRILPPGGAEFMLALGRRLPLAEALDIALSNAPGFDPQSGFGVLVNAGAVTEVIVEETTA